MGVSAVQFCLFAFMISLECQGTYVPSHIKISSITILLKLLLAGSFLALEGGYTPYFYGVANSRYVEKNYFTLNRMLHGIKRETLISIKLPLKHELRAL